MFMDFTLCPGGAFIQCESVAEFDPNMPSPVTPEVRQEVVAELKPQVEHYQTVDKVLHKLSDKADAVLNLYDTEILADRENAIALLDNVGNLATEIANCMVMLVTKLNAMRAACVCDQFVYEGVYNNLGYFIKNAPKLRKQGYTKIMSSNLVLPAVCGYDVNRMLALYLKAYSIDLPDFPFDFDQIRNALAYSDNAGSVFDDARDMIVCLYQDPERRYRLERQESIQFDLDSIINSATYCDNENIKIADDQMAPRIVKFISLRLSVIKKRIYDLQLALMDDQQDNDSQIKIRRIIAGTVDLFVIPMIYCLSIAYEVQSAINNHNIINQFATDCMKTVK